MEDTICDLANDGSLEARIQLLKMELERIKFVHNKELADLKHNTGKF